MISKEILTDYIFDLLEEADRKMVEKAIKENAETAWQHQLLKLKFSQLNLLEENSLYKNRKKPVRYILLSAAALLFLSFSVFTFLKHQPPQTLTTLPETHEVFTEIPNNESRYLSLEKLEYFEENLNSEPLLYESAELVIPEIKIQYDNEDYEIVDLKTFSTLKLPAQSSENLINPNLILISYLQ